MPKLTLCSSANASRSCVAISRRARRFRITNLKKARATLTLATHRRAPARTVHLSELFTQPNRSLVIYHLMYGKRQARPCPMCTAWCDGANGVGHHLAQNLDFAVVAAAELPALRAHARTHGWDKLRLLSAGNSTFKYDLGSENAEEQQDSAISVFTRDGDGTLHHFYTAHPWMAADVKERGIDLLAPIWHFLDLTPQGRGNWYTSLEYGTKVQTASR